jgi:hypothetical protein
LAVTNNILELEKYKALLLATIDYELERVPSVYKADELALVQDNFSKMKEKIEKYYVADGLTKLKKSLQQFTVPLMQLGDLAFSPYIKSKTGYYVDLFANITERLQRITDRNAIKNRQELKDVIAMIALCRQTLTYKYNVAHLKNMIIDYHRLQSKRLQQQEHYFFQVAEMSSPDFLHYIEVYEADNTATQIQITLRVGGKSIGFFSAEGVNLGLKVYWKNDTHIIIEHNKTLMASAKPKQIETCIGCFLQIEYVLIG